MTTRIDRRYAKLAQENLIKQSDVPYTILRSTQFFEFVSRIAAESSDGKLAAFYSFYRCGLSIGNFGDE